MYKFANLVLGEKLICVFFKYKIMNYNEIICKGLAGGAASGGNFWQECI